MAAQAAAPAYHVKRARQDQASSVEVSAWSAPQFRREIVMKPVATGRWTDMADANGEVAKPLVGDAALGVIPQQRRECSDDCIAIDVAPVQLVHPRAVEGAAQVKIVDTRAATDQADLRQIGPRAAIGTACHADGYVVLRQSDVFQLLFKTREQVG